MKTDTTRSSRLRRTFLRSLLILGSFFVSPAWSAEHLVRMLNAGADGSMVFEPAFVQAQVGDNLRFEPSSSGHFVRSLAVPDGAKPWLSEMDQPFVVTLTQPGLYFYNCPPHLMMGMVGLVQVGDAVNRSQAAAVMKSTQGRIYSHGARVDSLLALVK